MFYQTTIYLPTLWGWLLIFLILFMLVYIYIKTIHGFLAIHRPLNAEVLILEGWMRDYALKQAAHLIKVSNYKAVVVTGGQLDRGEFLSEYKSFAHLSKATLVRLGVSEALISEVPTPYTNKDRTNNSALLVSQWLADHPQYSSANVLTLGIHARRSFSVFRKAVPSNVDLGIISVDYGDYDADQWWKTSAGVRWVISEQIAYIYYKLFG